MDIATLSKIGARKQNQDSLGWKQANGIHLFVLADGLGGHAGGIFAAKMAVALLLDMMPATAEQLAEAFEKAHQTICAAQKNYPEQAQMASTLVALVIKENQAIWAHVGDARIYRIRNGIILHQSKDHSIPQLLVSDGEITAEQIRHHPDRNRLHRALGDTHTQINPRLSPGFQQIEPGDIFLLCSDGFWEWVTEEQMLADLANSSSSRQWLDNMEASLLAQAYGNIDNYSAIAIFC